ncbi:MAG: Maf family nucleotide pyrophosphatase [Alphaproteobacteria bacterium]
MQLILASQSPRRKELLGRLVAAFEVMPADVDETELKGEKPLDYCQRVAKAKAMKIHAEQPQATVLAADTPVIVGRRILQTAHTLEQAREMLGHMSGRRIYVPTAMCVITPEGKVFEDVAVSWLKLKKLTAAEMNKHVADPQNWEGASGAFKIQTSGFEQYVIQLHGHLSGIMGLSLYHTAKLLRRADVIKG